MCEKSPKWMEKRNQKSRGQNNWQDITHNYSRKLHRWAINLLSFSTLPMNMEELDFWTTFKLRSDWPNLADDFFNDIWIKLISIEYWSSQFLVFFLYVVQLILYANPWLYFPRSRWNFTLRSDHHSFILLVPQLFEQVLILIPVEFMNSSPLFIHLSIVFYFGFSTHKALTHIQSFKWWTVVIFFWCITPITKTITLCHVLFHLFMHFLVFSSHFQMGLLHISHF